MTQLLALLGVTAAVLALTGLAKHFLIASPRLPTWPAYAFTGMVGSPIRETARAVVCLCMGFKLTRIALYKRSDADGTLGYVDYTFFPGPLSYMGRALEGLAPCAVGCVLLCLLTGIAYDVPAPPQNPLDILVWIPSAMQEILWSLWTEADSDPLSLLIITGLFLVSLHAVPTLTDLHRLSYGLITFTPIAAFIGALLWFIRSAHFPYIEGLFIQIERWLVPWTFEAVQWIAVSSLMLCVAAVLSALLFVVIPTLAVALWHKLTRKPVANPEAIEP